MYKQLVNIIGVAVSYSYCLWMTNDSSCEENAGVLGFRCGGDHILDPLLRCKSSVMLSGWI